MRQAECGADGPAREKPEAKTSKRNVSAIRPSITQPLRVLIATLREIFDEAAYQRFLARGEIASSPGAYADFLRETESAKARRPKCCCGNVCRWSAKLQPV